MSTTALQQEIQKYAARGFFVVHQTDTTAQLRKPKQFNFWAFITLGVLLFIIGGALYVAWYATQKDLLIYLTVDENGAVHATGTGLSTQPDPQLLWEERAVGKSLEDFEKELARARKQKLTPEHIHWLENKVAAYPSTSSTPTERAQ